MKRMTKNEYEEQDVADDKAEEPKDPDLVRKPIAEGDLQQSQPHDYWLKRGYFMARVHNIPRTHKFSPILCDDRPEDVEGGIPVENFDVTRVAYTSLHEFGKGLARIEDVWTAPKAINSP